MRTLLIAMAAVVIAAAPVSQADPRPNVLFAIADDWGFGHAGVYGDKVVKTPHFDRVSREGVLFTNAYCASPSCTPSRAGILAGQYIHRLEDTGNLHSQFPARFEVYPDLLETAGYVVGLTGKGWGPGNEKAGGRTRNPAGPRVRGFRDFLKSVPAGKPFCYWFGSTDPHRPYMKGSGTQEGMKPGEVTVPPWLPDTPEVRSDILDYYVEVQRFDRAVGDLLRDLEDSGRAANTIVVVTSDNGMPFPRSKANVYDSGTRMPLAIRWPAKAKGGRTIDAFVSHTDYAPTFLEAAGLKPPEAITGRSLVPILLGGAPEGRDQVFLERERHANVRKGDLSYPCRAIRTKEFLYVRNLRPDRWPAGDPEKHISVGPYGDIDGSPSKDLVITRRSDPAIAKYFALACEKRPAEELFDLAKDPGQIENVAARPEYAAALESLRARVDRWMAETNDPRVNPEDDRWDRFPYYGQ